VANPQELLQGASNKRFDTQIIVHSAKLPVGVSETFVTYLLENKPFKTDKVKLQPGSTDALYRYERIHTFKQLSQELIDYVATGNITFKVFGMVDLNSEHPFLARKEAEFSTNVKRKAENSGVVAVS
jgi:hypothetical protein